ncbi:MULTISPECIES: phospholipase D-like domain-containing protein DpdK [unclassified Nodularia (in: cyanobacteria)]|uniref:phospholipase D-like domain-containing protein DpdK n=1 Tax=unclassified Nodularia (in: cyanobacteria) TaxID=2656917 RepID=UPI00187EDBA5|nr:MULTISPECIES: phospholipase D-like domain-containing protein DpdK [unclassified Nodularia (in: cyanobacteria)]MBE9200065.1 phosphatidylserine/phosphatidylglycerophosphate/cardiolipin synthase family protein [Nodularia sp. LEGE 06071]MCC2691970.1 phosphatidylserine/phosphatidylglycerophosphate/cardiolipin synthase family protein [Nodularia sp. LEGE 04288]
MPSRYIHSRLSSRQIPDLLQTIFVAELINPSQCIWLVSPWISDIPVIDNTANTFLSLEPSWSRSRIRLSQILATLAEQGTTIYIATRPDSHNHSFLSALKLRNDGTNCHIHITEELHAKGILGDGYYLAGSMNFTYNGITVNEEAVIYETLPEIIAEQQVIFANRWGGVEP